MASPSGTRVLLTGAAGFIGAWVTRALVARGDQVTALIRPGESTGRLAAVEGQLDLRLAGLEDDAAIQQVIAEARPEVVLHLAWYARPSDYLTSPENLASLQQTLGLVDRALAAGCRKLVVAGTCLEYAPSAQRRVESDRIEPDSVYASCKAAGGLVAAALARQHGAELAWARIFHLHGPGEDPARLIPWVARSLRAGETVALSPGQQVRDHLHVADVAAALVHLTGPGLGGAFNVCSGQPVSLAQVLTCVGELVGRPELLRFGDRPYAAREVMFLAGDASRLRDAGWAPAFPTLRDSLAYLAEAAAP